MFGLCLLIVSSIDERLLATKTLRSASLQLLIGWGSLGSHLTQIPSSPIMQYNDLPQDLPLDLRLLVLTPS